MMAGTLRVGAFFDGTGNHKDNDYLIKDGSGCSNIVKLYEMYEGKKFYETGAGTRALEPFEIDQINADEKKKEDFFSFSGAAFGSDAHSKVENMLDKIARFIENHPNEQIIIDVFGFSRGAAEARDFINHFNEKYANNDNVKIGFSGLFDTVASIGLANEYNNEFNLNLSSASAEKIVHIVAQDEVRSNFPLESLKDEKGKLSSNVEEVRLIGSHSDIGGGYLKKEKEVHIVHSESLTFNNEYEKQEKLEELNERFKGESRTVVVVFDRVKSGQSTEDVFPDREARFEVHETKMVSHDLSNVSLSLMHQKALEFGLPLRDIESVKYTEVPLELKGYESAVLRGETNLTPFVESAQPFLHQSHTDNRAEISIGDRFAHFKDWDDERNIYFNEPHSSVLRTDENNNNSIEKLIQKLDDTKEELSSPELSEISESNMEEEMDIQAPPVLMR